MLVKGNLKIKIMPSSLLKEKPLQTIDMNQVTSHLFYLILHYKFDILCDKGIFDKEIRLINECLEANDICRTISLIETNRRTSPM